MNGFNVYEYYCSLKAHFNTESYDFFKYKKKTGVKQSSYLKRSDKSYFEWVARNKQSKEIIPFLLSTFVIDKKAWIGELTSSDCERIHTIWRSKMDSLAHMFETDVKFLKDLTENKDKKFIDLFSVNNGHPQLLKLVVGSHINIETVIIMNKISNFINIFDKELRDDLLWNEWRLLILKYDPFIKIDIRKYKEILIKIIR